VKKIKSPIPHFQFENLQQHSNICSHAVFTRHGGVSDKPFDSLNVRYSIGDDSKSVDENRIRITKALSIESLNSADQTHSKNIEAIPSSATKTKYNEFTNTDALISNITGHFLMVQVADCQPILLLDPVKKAVACIHSGWRGTIKNIVGTTIDTMIRSFQTEPEDLIASVGPSLGTCCSEFKNREKEFPKEFNKFFVNKDNVDLEGITKNQMIKKGIKPSNIQYSGICTKCNSNNFYSYRAEKKTGRFGVVIGLI